MTCGSASRLRGSSPRVRGKPVQHRRAPQGRRLIPARAGKTRRSILGVCPLGAHPRACGENSRRPTARAATSGSSPRVRGKRLRRHRPHDRRGLIPARAGKTRARRPAGAARPAHPRACGENLIDNANPLAQLGSSPRVRGKLAVVAAQVPDERLIPARAGKTPSAWERSWSTQAHPRACGENGVGGDARRCGGGSSPRVRGKPCVLEAAHQAGRLIPARAGKTWACPRRR